MTIPMFEPDLYRDAIDYTERRNQLDTGITVGLAVAGQLTILGEHCDMAIGPREARALACALTAYIQHVSE